jgi:hypothetical protein
MLKFHQRTETELDPETGKKRVIPFKEQYWLDHPVRLCCTNQLTDGAPLSPDGFIPRLL